MYVLTLAAVLVLVAGTLAALGQIAVTRHRAAAGADLAALAAAGRALQGASPACAVAQDVAQAQGARLISCRMLGETSDVVVEVRPHGRLGLLAAARARARAGPAGAVPS